MAMPDQLDEKEALKNSTRYPPPLPPRVLSNSGAPPLPPRAASNLDVSPPYSAHDSGETTLLSQQWIDNDPKSSSTQSLVPSESREGERRRLLLIYIHGFMGSETSFQSFPAHVQNILAVTLAETHVVHTKIYPRYKTRGAIEFARDGFSNWQVMLEPHENALTDVILLGHSLGGLLAAEVVLKAGSPENGQALQHRILGTVGFDSPFLGMHPGVISSGIGSLFRAPPEPPGQGLQKLLNNEARSSKMASQTSISSTENGLSTVNTGSSSQPSFSPSYMSPLASPPPHDPNFDPPFPNDVRIKDRDRWNNKLHFLNKHSNGLTSATKQYFMSHLEFGGCLADYPRLVDRYQMLRNLEGVNEYAGRANSVNGPHSGRVRFVNYYTASTGRLKPPKVKAGKIKEEDGPQETIGFETTESTLSSMHSSSSESIQQISTDGNPENTATSQKLEDQIQNLEEPSENHDIDELPEMLHLDPTPIQEEDDFPEVTDIASSVDFQRPDKEYPLSPSESLLPPIPDMPEEPSPVDLSLYQDKNYRKIAEKEYKRTMKAYQQAMKDRAKAIKDRRKLAEKQEKKARQEREKQLKIEEKEMQKEMKAQEKLESAATNSQSPIPPESSQINSKAKKDKKFCMLPLQLNGELDKCWVRVYMEGVDEIEAHSGLFLPGLHYEGLVRDVSARIEEWIRDDVTRRLAEIRA